MLTVLTVSAINVFALNNAEIVKRNDNATKYIALTFDDGPHARYTDEILDILKENDVKATFFVIGENAKTHPEILKRIANEGHEIGNHTYHHVYISKCGRDKITKEIKETENTVYSITGTRPIVFRPPGGYYSKESIEQIRNMGYECVLWSVDTKDWTLPAVEKVISTVSKETVGGDIILFHDHNQKGSPTPSSVRRLIPMLKEKGYTFLTVSELLDVSENNVSQETDE